MNANRINHHEHAIPPELIESARKTLRQSRSDGLDDVFVWSFSGNLNTLMREQATALRELPPEQQHLRGQLEGMMLRSLRDLAQGRSEGEGYCWSVWPRQMVIDRLRKPIEEGGGGGDAIADVVESNLPPNWYWLVCHFTDGSDVPNGVSVVPIYIPDAEDDDCDGEPSEGE